MMLFHLTFAVCLNCSTGTRFAAASSLSFSVHSSAHHCVRLLVSALLCPFPRRRRSRPPLFHHNSARDVTALHTCTGTMSYPPFQHEVASEMHTLSEIDPLFSTFAELHSSQSAIDCSSAWTIIDKIIAFTDCILYLSKVLLFLSLDDTCWRNVVAIYRTHPQNFQAMLLLWPDLYHGLPAELMHLLQQLRDDAHWDLVKEGALSALEGQPAPRQRTHLLYADLTDSTKDFLRIAALWCSIGQSCILSDLDLIGSIFVECRTAKHFESHNATT